MTSQTGKIMGLDIGDARIGVALSDDGCTLATPLEIVERSAGDPVGRIASLAQTSGAYCIVAGLPRNMDGSLGPQARKVKGFASKLKEANPNVQIEYWDERLSTVEARSMLVRSGASKSKRAEHVDAMSAAIILQGYLDRKKMQKPSAHERAK